MKKTFLIVVLALLGITQAMAQREDYLPIVREGVQWVNEKVIVNNGDTTCYYYKYEFSGTDSIWLKVNHALYYYTGDHLDVERDSLIAGLQEGLYGNDYVTSLRNNSLIKAAWDGRKLLQFDVWKDGGTTLLYRLGNHSCDDYYLDIIEWSHSYGSDLYLTTDNFIEVEPITIEGIECERYAYIGEYGDTLAYVVEGIGFDSRDMGDLLTPFIRKLNPTTQYQDWWGLSHVLKDGKIIYKGMRYREGAFDGINEVVIEKACPMDDNYYNMMGQPVGKVVPTTPGIYIHHGQKICVSFIR